MAYHSLLALVLKDLVQTLATGEALCMLVLEMCQQGKGMDIGIREIWGRLGGVV